MQQFKNLKFVILIIVVLLILVIVRISDQGLFKKDVKTAIEASRNNSNLLTLNQLRQLKEPWMVVNIGANDIPDSLQIEHSMKISFENLLDQTDRKILEGVTGDLILYSADVATASKAWIIMNQMGFKNVFILNTVENPEDIKYKFQPDTTARLEQDSI
jgi:nitrogen fixation/metabolism regulation signal transduction histidine kinase